MIPKRSMYAVSVMGLVAAGLLSGGVAAAADASASLPPALTAAAEKALERGTAYLLENQEDNGAWGELPHPGTCGLCAMALCGAPGSDGPQVKKAIDAAMAFILQYRQDDGSIYPAGYGKNASANYPNYSTCIALMAMAMVDKPEYVAIMAKARAYLKAVQFADPDSPDYGGLGYGHSGRADLSNAGWAAEALYFTEYLDREPYGKDPKAAKSNAVMWQRLGKFLTACQNLPATNPGKDVSTDSADVGGFAYMTTASKAGTRPDPKDGVPNLVSSGSMTYAGLKSMIYARLDRQDARVRGAVDYARKHFTLDENPGMGLQAYYFYVYTMVRALDIYGQETLTLADGTKLKWRRSAVTKIVSLQKDDGSWWNDRDARYMESMPELTTPYMMLALEVALGHDRLQRHR